ncbi:unnamed protein product [Blepharisma stoltei]|uniref:Photosystem I assembly protein Ycf4 n=1 Tax=Blepharisma stoltei TaxID=1481888 RepID=A0AAU9J057_9CILI|nr:unnamed protein product [Blepharisma stoltei]
MLKSISRTFGYIPKNEILFTRGKYKVLENKSINFIGAGANFLSLGMFYKFASGIYHHYSTMSTLAFVFDSTVCFGAGLLSLSIAGAVGGIVSKLCLLENGNIEVTTAAVWGWPRKTIISQADLVDTAADKDIVERAKKRESLAIATKYKTYYWLFPYGTKVKDKQIAHCFLKGIEVQINQ